MNEFDIFQKYNRKIKYYLKVRPELEDVLPQTIKKKEYTTLDEERKKLMLKKAKAFLKKEAMSKDEKGRYKFQKDIYEIQKQYINKQRQKQKEKIESKVSTQAGTMGSIRRNELRKRTKKASELSKSELAKAIKSMEKSLDKDYSEIYKSSYLKSLQVNLGIGEGDKLYDYFASLSSENLYDLYLSDAELQIDFVYDNIYSAVIYETISSRLQNFDENAPNVTAQDYYDYILSHNELDDLLL